ncbi:MAG: DUF5320 domain-containing protein [Syntrophorhabdaceae bacterium]|nr:DUF5320 domain-containing protein [Syntrophorhabdaceae bacterium]MDD4195705.1 DUF5320 domain-containing protein [Syntrophorhabdaceae bacterium]HOC45734.1 DUF5320 domain-containing protein [Syntrophorhabdaceae bacterium]
MPRGDGTGPRGLGPMTGRAAGFCTGFAAPGFAPYCAGWRPRAGGRGFRNRFYRTGLTAWQRSEGYIPLCDNRFEYTGPRYEPARTPFMAREQEMANLKTHAKYLEDALEDIRARIKQLEDSKQEAQAG